MHFLKIILNPAIIGLLLLRHRIYEIKNKIKHADAKCEVSPSAFDIDLRQMISAGGSLSLVANFS